MIKLRASATIDRSWGPDRLGNALLNPGQSRTFVFENIPSCSYDFNAEYLDEVTIDRRRVDICNTTRWVAN